MKQYNPCCYCGGNTAADNTVWVYKAREGDTKYYCMSCQHRVTPAIDDMRSYGWTLKCNLNDSILLEPFEPVENKLSRLETFVRETLGTQ